MGKTLPSQITSYDRVSHSAFAMNFVDFSMDFGRPKIVHGEIERD
jgi:hypothetical protein